MPALDWLAQHHRPTLVSAGQRLQLAQAHPRAGDTGDPGQRRRDRGRALMSRWASGTTARSSTTWRQRRADALLLSLLSARRRAFLPGVRGGGVPRSRILRLSLCIEENAVLKGIGAEQAEGMFIAAGYFDALRSGTPTRRSRNAAATTSGNAPRH
jgi:hypothetical protein